MMQYFLTTEETSRDIYHRQRTDSHLQRMHAVRLVCSYGLLSWHSRAATEFHGG